MHTTDAALVTHRTSRRTHGGARALIAGVWLLASRWADGLASMADIRAFLLAGVFPICGPKWRHPATLVPKQRRGRSRASRARGRSPCARITRARSPVNSVYRPSALRGAADFTESPPPIKFRARASVCPLRFAFIFEGGGAPLDILDLEIRKVARIRLQIRTRPEPSWGKRPEVYGAEVEFDSYGRGSATRPYAARVD